jgi:hypothetical protein
MRTGKRCKQHAAIWRAPMAPLALAGPKTSRNNASQYFKPTYTRRDRKFNALRRHCSIAT